MQCLRRASSNNPPLLVETRVPGTEEEDGDRTRKRTRQSAEVAEVKIKNAGPETALEVDHMILDYIAYSATKAVLALNASTAKGSSTAVRKSLATADAFLSKFKTRHPGYMPDPELLFRVMLLQLCTLFTQRFVRSNVTPSNISLKQLRERNQHRAMEWMASEERRPSFGIDVDVLDTALPMAMEDLERNRARTLHDLAIPAENEAYDDTFYGTLSCVALLDIVPLFMKVSAASNSLCNSNTRPRWMQLAAKFMVQACLEQFLVFGNWGSDAVDEAFSWGYKPQANTQVNGNGPDESEDRDEVNSMFKDEDRTVETKQWAATKKRFLRRLLIPDLGQTDTFGKHLERRAADFPVAAFHVDILEYLTALSQCISPPVLSQLESGKLDGMSAEETKMFLASHKIVGLV